MKMQLCEIDTDGPPPIDFRDMVRSLIEARNTSVYQFANATRSMSANRFFIWLRGDSDIRSDTLARILEELGVVVTLEFSCAHPRRPETH